MKHSEKKKNSFLHVRNLTCLVSRELKDRHRRTVGVVESPRHYSVGVSVREEPHGTIVTGR